MASHYLSNSVNANAEPEIEVEETSVSSPAAIVMRSMLRELHSHYSIPRIATYIGMSQATIRRMLQGTTLNPSSRTFDKLLRLYCAECCTPESHAEVNLQDATEEIESHHGSMANR